MSEYNYILKAVEYKIDEKDGHKYYHSSLDEYYEKSCRNTMIIQLLIVIYNYISLNGEFIPKLFTPGTQEYEIVKVINNYVNVNNLKKREIICKGKYLLKNVFATVSGDSFITHDTLNSVIRNHKIEDEKRESIEKDIVLGYIKMICFCRSLNILSEKVDIETG